MMDLSTASDSELIAELSRRKALVTHWSSEDIVRVVQSDTPFGLEESRATAVAQSLLDDVQEGVFDNSQRASAKLLSTYLRCNRSRILRMSSPQTVPVKAEVRENKNLPKLTVIPGNKVV